MSKAPTMLDLRLQAKRVFGDDFVDIYDRPCFVGTPRVKIDAREVVLLIAPRRQLAYAGRSRAAARKFALETLRLMPSKDLT